MLVSVCVLAFMLSATSAFADKELTVKPVETITPTPIILSTSGLPVGCQVGNLNPAAWAISNFMLPPEEYKLTFDPRATCSACPIGFAVNTVHVIMQVAEACDLVMEVNVEEASYPNGPDCPSPGPVLCSSGFFNVTLPGAGLYDVALPISCECFTMDRLYLLSFYIDSFSCATGTTPDLILDAGPATLCTNWNNFGAGWYDLLGQFPAWPGNLVFYADAECCTPPVPVDEKTWGAIKALYED
jgi:hypothetical protein